MICLSHTLPTKLEGEPQHIVLTYHSHVLPSTDVPIINYFIHFTLQHDAWWCCRCPGTAMWTCGGATQRPSRRTIAPLSGWMLRTHSLCSTPAAAPASQRWGAHHRQIKNKLLNGQPLLGQYLILYLHKYGRFYIEDHITNQC